VKGAGSKGSGGEALVVRHGRERTMAVWWNCADTGFGSLRYIRCDQQVLQSYSGLSFESVELHVCVVMLLANIQICVAGRTLKGACEPGSRRATSGSASVAWVSTPNPHNASSFSTIRPRETKLQYAFV
jgi:hypothetical protein